MVKLLSLYSVLLWEGGSSNMVVVLLTLDAATPTLVSGHYSITFILEQKGHTQGGLW